MDNHWSPEINQCVMIAAPHTSNWDALYARLALKAMAVPVRITIKDSYMRFPFGPFIRAMGGIGINRRPKQAGEERPSMVQVMTDLFAQHPKLVMLVTPEGTRARREHWKSGFYHVAINTGVPIALSYLDYQKKTVGVGKIIYPTGNMEQDMREIMQFYADISPKFPELFSLDTRYVPWLKVNIAHYSGDNTFNIKLFIPKNAQKPRFLRWVCAFFCGHNSTY